MVKQKILVGILIITLLIGCWSVSALAANQVYGDLNGDQILSAADALVVLQATVGKQKLTSSQLKYADVNGDGNANATDALLILQKVVGKIYAFPVESNPPHEHSYSKEVTKPTCTTSGYTTYTCSCGDTYKGSYTSPSHTYTEFICYSCGAIDKQNANKYLVEYVKTNGKANGSFVSITMRETDDTKYELKYDAQNKCLWATCREETQTTVTTSGLAIEDGYYGLNLVLKNYDVSEDLAGFIDPKTFNENSPMTYEVYTGVDSTKTSALNIARYSLLLTIVEMERFFDTHNVGLCVYALGYMGLQ